MGFDQETSIKILTDLKAAAEIKPLNVVTEGKLNVEFSTAFNNTIKSTNQNNFKISDDVQNFMVTLRRLGCDIQAGLFDGNCKVAQEKYLELISQADNT